MATIPQNTAAQRALALRFERNRNAFGQAMARATGGIDVREGAVHVWGGPFLHPYFGLMSPTWPARDVAKNLRRAITLYRPARSAMFVQLGAGLRSETDALYRTELQAAGFRCSYHVPVLHLDLAALRASAAGPADLRVERVSSFEIFRRVPHPWLGRGRTPVQKLRFNFYRQECERPRPRLWQFIARRGDAIVGGAMIFRHGRTAGVYDVAVDRRHRRQGIGTALMVAACCFAREQGMTDAGLSASSLGLGLYHKVGFTDAGRYSDYFLSKTRVAAWRPSR